MKGQFSLLRWRLLQSSFDHTEEPVVVADGAILSWNAVVELFPNEHQILDLYHFRYRFTQMATARWGTASTPAADRQVWVKAQFAAMKKGRWQ